MKMYIMTDLEGVAGVTNVDDWLGPDGRYHERGKRFLTLEVNAAIDAFAANGFDDILVNDAHGHGGIDPELLDPRVRLVRAWRLDQERPSWPGGLDESDHAAAVVGQHAKAGTPRAHIPHTQWWDHLDFSVNGVSMGEYGQFAMVAGQLDIPVIFASGDKAFCAEAEALTGGVVTAAVKVGTFEGTGAELTGEQYAYAFQGAVHLHPMKARDLIRLRAEAAAQGFVKDRSAFKPLEFTPPFRMVCKTRCHRGKPAATYTAQGTDSLEATLIRLWKKMQGT